MDEKGYLAEWMRQFLSSRNLIFRTIDSIGPHEKFELHVKHKAKDQYVVAEPVFGSGTIARLEQDKHILLAGFNTEENFQFILDNWKQLVGFPNLAIYLINPLSEPDKKWIISPYVHQRVCDSASLKTGLRAMFETVMPLTSERIQSLIKRKE